MRLWTAHPCSPPVAAGIALAVGTGRLNDRLPDLEADFGSTAGAMLREATISARSVPVSGTYPRMNVKAPQYVFDAADRLASEIGKSPRLVREYAIEIGAQPLFELIVHMVQHAQQFPTVGVVANELCLDGNDWSDYEYLSD